LKKSANHHRFIWFHQNSNHLLP